MNIYSIKSLVLLLCLALLASCSDDMRMPDPIKSTLPKLAVDESADLLIAGEDFEGKVIVDLLFKDQPQNAKVVIAKNGDYKTVKVLKDNVTTFPQTVTITGTQLTELFGTPIVSGDYVEVGMDVLLSNGLWVSVFNPYGLGSSSQANQLPGSNPVVKFKAVCPLNLDDFIGTAELGDGLLEETYTVDVARKGENKLVISGMLGLEAPYGVIELSVDESRHSVNADKADYAAELDGLTNLVLKSIKGEIDACKGSISFSAAASCDQGSFGSVSFVLTMKVD